MINTDKDSGIMYRQWGRPGPKACFLMVHGLGAHSARWEAAALYLTKAGFLSYAIELKGFGRTGTRKGHISSFQVYFNDILSLREIMKRENPGSKVFIAGESLGALISFSLSGKYADKFDGLICISPAFKSRMRLPVWKYAMAAAALICYPSRQFRMPFDSGMCTRDEEYRGKMDNDEREHRLASAKLLFETVRTGLLSGKTAGKIVCPVLFLVPGKDKLIDPLESSRVFGRISSQDRTIIKYPDMYHSLTIDSGKEQVFGDILKWAEDRAGAR